MSLLPALLLFASAGSLVDMASERHVIPRNDWRYRDITSIAEPALVKINFTVESGPPVRIELISQQGIERLKRGQPAGSALASAPETKGELQARLPDPSEYAVVIDNRGNDSSAATVRLTVSLDYSAGTQTGVRRLSPQRQLTVIALSFVVFFGIVAFSARTLWRNTQGGRGGGFDV
jgi:hypothetical protein